MFFSFRKVLFRETVSAQRNEAALAKNAPTHPPYRTKAGNKLKKFSDRATTRGIKTT